MGKGFERRLELRFRVCVREKVTGEVGGLARWSMRTIAFAVGKKKTVTCVGR